MNQYCSGCGKKLRPYQEVCLNCGKMIKKDKRNENFGAINIYSVVCGIITVLIGILIDIKAEDVAPFKEIEILQSIGVCTIIAGCFMICNCKYHSMNKVISFVTGVFLIICAIGAISIIETIGLATLAILIFGILNLVFSFF